MELKRIHVVLFLFCIALILDVVIILILLPLSWVDIPVLGLGYITYPVFVIIIPFVFGILALFASRLFIAAGLRLWKWRKKDFQIRRKSSLIHTLSPMVIATRVLLTVLLVFGIIPFIIEIVPYSWFIPPEEVAGTDKYNLAFLTSMTGILFVVSIISWSVSWTLEDAGIIYQDDNKCEKPLHQTYDSLIKGYAGISTILFIIQYMWDLYHVKGLLFPIRVVALFIHLCLITVPAMYVYSRWSLRWNERGWLKNVPL